MYTYTLEFKNGSVYAEPRFFGSKELADEYVNSIIPEWLEFTNTANPVSYSIYKNDTLIYTYTF